MKINVVKDQLNQNTYIFFNWFYDPLFIWICWPQFKYVDIEHSDKVWPVVNTDSNVSVTITCVSGNIASVSLDNLVMAWYLISVFIGTLGSIFFSTCYNNNIYHTIVCKYFKMINTFDIFSTVFLWILNWYESIANIIHAHAILQSMQSQWQEVKYMETIC